MAPQWLAELFSAPLMSPMPHEFLRERAAFVAEHRGALEAAWRLSGREGLLTLWREWGFPALAARVSQQRGVAPRGSAHLGEAPRE